MGKDELTAALALLGLRSLGSLVITAEDKLPLTKGSLILIGPDEPHFWPVFTNSPEYRDGLPDPLDRWSKARLDAVAEDLGAHALYPFGGPPYQPFQRWALRSGQAWTSPIGFLVHADAGLFVSYRGALLVPWEAEHGQAANPCDTCADQPCRSACPVNAFATGYDVAACKAHLRNDPAQACMTTGCQARHACPVGQSRRLPDQAAFHMKAFL